MTDEKKEERRKKKEEKVELKPHHTQNAQNLLSYDILSPVFKRWRSILF